MSDVAEDLFSLLNDHCTADQIKDIIRDAKEIAPELVLGSTKPETLRSLREAIDRHAIPIERAYELLQRSEENGHQHIFYFRASDAAVQKKCADGPAIAESIFGKNWQKAHRFPRFRLVPNGYTWADFRIPGGSGGKEWIAKVYGLEHKKELVRERTRGDRLYQIWTTVTKRKVCLARWHRDLLEIRVPTSKSRKTIRYRLDEVWSKLDPALTQAEFRPWDLAPARRRMFDERDRHKKLYRLCDLRFLDPEGGRTTFCPPTEDEGPSPVMEDAFNSYKACECRDLDIFFMPNGGVLQSTLRVYAGGFETHEIVISARTSPQAVDYVTHNFRSFSR